MHTFPAIFSLVVTDVPHLIQQVNRFACKVFFLFYRKAFFALALCLFPVSPLGDESREAIISPVFSLCPCLIFINKADFFKIFLKIVCGF